MIFSLFAEGETQILKVVSNLSDFCFFFEREEILICEIAINPDLNANTLAKALSDYSPLTLI